MTFRVTVSTIIEADIMVEADSEDEAFEKIEDGVYVDAYVNDTAGFEVKSWADESISIEEIYANCDIELADIEEV